jgi:hypothetical protein
MTIGSYLAATLNRPPNALPLAACCFLYADGSLKALTCGFLSEPFAGLLILTLRTSPDETLGALYVLSRSACGEGEDQREIRSPKE